MRKLIELIKQLWRTPWFGEPQPDPIIIVMSAYLAATNKPPAGRFAGMRKE